MVEVANLLKKALVKTASMSRPKLLTAGALITGLVTPRIRRRFSIPAPVTVTAAYMAPFAAYLLMAPSNRRRAVVCGLQMSAYFTLFAVPNDRPQRLLQRVRIDYPIVIDRLIGWGELPSLRLQRRFSRPGHIRRFEKPLVWSHWIWFMVPHLTVAYTVKARPERAARAAAMIYTTFNLGGTVYSVLPTAPPWFAAQKRQLTRSGDCQLRRVMPEYGQQLWGEKNWQRMFGSLDGNPVAAMPSLHFGTSLMAAHMLREIGPLPGAVGLVYAGTLGFALVYLGEHYVADLLGGLILVELIRKADPRVRPLLERSLARVKLMQMKVQAAQ